MRPIERGIYKIGMGLPPALDDAYALVITRDDDDHAVIGKWEYVRSLQVNMRWANIIIPVPSEPSAKYTTVDTADLSAGEAVLTERELIW